MIKQIHKLLNKLKTNNKGVAAIEFAIIFPMMVLTYFGLAELTQAIRIDRKVTQLSDTLVNLTARSSAVTETDIENIFDATASVMAPFRETNTKLRLTFLNITEAGKGTVVWSCSRHIDKHAKDTKLDIPVEFNQTGTVLVMAESDYTYKPMLKLFFMNDLSLTETKYQYPRKDTFIEIENPSSVCGGQTTNPDAPTPSTPEEIATKQAEDCAQAQSQGKVGDDGGAINAHGQYVKCGPPDVKMGGTVSQSTGWGAGPVWTGGSGTGTGDDKGDGKDNGPVVPIGNGR